MTIFTTEKKRKEEYMKKPIIGMIMAVMSLTAVCVSAETYYVSNGGNDANTGLAEDAAWASIERVNSQEFMPGDKILFESGGEWDGSLQISGSGKKGKLIEVNSYGNGAKPIINGNGAIAAVYLNNREYISINNLELTNSGTEEMRYGLYVGADNCGALHDIKIKYLTVHDVNGLYTNDSGNTQDMTNNHWNGGIVAIANGTSVPTRFVGLTIQGCEVYDVARSGIVTFSNMYTKYDKQIAGMSQKLQVANNKVHDIKGDGIIVCGDYNGELFGNTVYNTNLMSYYNEKTAVNVGIFVIHSTGTHIFNNESYLCRTTNDGYGYDIDGDCDDILMEYNYSHDNDGGFLMIVNHNTKNVTVRYNVSKNDKSRSIAIPVASDSSLTHTMSGKIYNNTIYSEVKESWHTIIDGLNENVEVYNNIFDLRTGGTVISQSIGTDSGIKMSNNLFYGHSNINEVAQGDLNPIKKDPLYENAESAGNGYSSSYGLKPAGTSPCIGAGVYVPNNGGYDFVGNKLSANSAVSVGAFQ